MSNNTAALQLRNGALWIAIMSMVVSLFVPLIVGTNIADAAQLDNRAVHITDSASAATGVSYEFEFDIGTTGNVQALAIQYCSDSPIIGDACTTPAGFNWNAGTAALSGQNGTNSGTGTTGTSGVVDWSINATASDADALILTRPAATSLTAGNTVTFSYDGVTNPTGVNTSFYLRIHTYAATGDIPYAGAGTDFDQDNATLNNVDDGGIALSTAETIDIEARVQEKLIFCVGTNSAVMSTNTQCTGGVTGNSVNLGVLDNTLVNEASTEDTKAYAQVTTNASNGVIVQYYGDTLKVGAADCSVATNVDYNGGGTPVTTDNCLNYDSDPETTNRVFQGGSGEQWGLAVDNINATVSGVTSNMTASAIYDFDNETPGELEYAFNRLAPTTIASSATVVDSELLEIDFGAAASITTPTGLYQTTLTFVATSTF